jgi:hypothetical protein
MTPSADPDFDRAGIGRSHMPDVRESIGLGAGTRHRDRIVNGAPVLLGDFGDETEMVEESAARVIGRQPFQPRPVDGVAVGNRFREFV